MKKVFLLLLAICFIGSCLVGCSQSQDYDSGTRISNNISGIDINDDSLARGYGPINEPIEIVQKQEIVLYLSIYSENSIRAIGDIQEYGEKPELLSDYPYVQMIKCRFE
jgi:hypothetical protein